MGHSWRREFEGFITLDFVPRSLKTMTTADTIQAVLAGTLVLLTGVYAWLTWGIQKANQAVVAAMRAEREATMRPYITISPFTLPDSVLIFLRIENTGRTAARNLRLTLDRPFFLFGDHQPNYDLQKRAAFAEKCESFNPGMRLVYILDSAVDLFGTNRKPGADEITPLLFHITASYEWDGGQVNETSSVDLRPYAGASIEHDPIVKQLKEMDKTIGKVKDALDRMPDRMKPRSFEMPSLR
jgi:hypothetical protein